MRLPPTPHNIILFELDFNINFPLLHLLQFLSDLFWYCVHKRKKKNGGKVVNVLVVEMPWSWLQAGILKCTAGENSIIAPKMQNDFWWTQNAKYLLVHFWIIIFQCWTFLYCCPNAFLWSKLLLFLDLKSDSKKQENTYRSGP